jgi:hypothetical protein
MIAECPPTGKIGSLLVFSDDWGRHPSSCQHLTRNLLDRYPVLWVNTIGTRAPRLDMQTMRRVAEKMRQWGTSGLTRVFRQNRKRSATVSQHEQDTPVFSNLQVVNPKMWPWFSSDRDRRFNRWLLTRQLSPLIEKLPKPVVAVTTLPITADLPDTLSVDRWIYYCVDDFSQWPGLDGDTLRRMDHDMIQQADSLIAVSETLQGMIASHGRSSSMLTHGVDVDFWNRQRSISVRPESVARRFENVRGQRRVASDSRLTSLSIITDSSDTETDDGQLNEKSTSGETPSASISAAEVLATPPTAVDGIAGPLIVFWGVIDRRMDSPSLIQLSQDLIEGTIVLIGPQQDPDPALLALPNVQVLPAQPLSALPAIAEQANVLIMPYADLPVTRAMQPLKLKEYLATGKSVVVKRLPSTDAWADCLDAAETPEEFSLIVRNRVYSGISPAQALARCRLHQESWKSKADRFEHILKSERVQCRLALPDPPVIAFKPPAPSGSQPVRSQR